jgi:hypothetical protein
MSISRMIETESPGMKGLASKSSDPSDPSSIDRITYQRKTEVLQMHSNLMRATRLQLTKYQRN